MLVSGHSFCVRIAAGFPSGLGKWLLRESCARRGHGSRGLVLPIDGRYGTTSCSGWAFAQGMAEALRAQEFARGSLGVIERVAPGCAIQVGSVGARSRRRRGVRPIWSRSDCLKIRGQVRGKRHLPNTRKSIRVLWGITLVAGRARTDLTFNPRNCVTAKFCSAHDSKSDIW
jgi:hypothetical protein